MRSISWDLTSTSNRIYKIKGRMNEKRLENFWNEFSAAVSHRMSCNHSIFAYGFIVMILIAMNGFYVKIISQSQVKIHFL